jgi:hypothetical protein
VDSERAVDSTPSLRGAPAVDDESDDPTVDDDDDPTVAVVVDDPTACESMIAVVVPLTGVSIGTVCRTLSPLCFFRGGGVVTVGDDNPTARDSSLANERCSFWSEVHLQGASLPQ